MAVAALRRGPSFLRLTGRPSLRAPHIGVYFQSTSLGKERYRWTKDRDELLRKLVTDRCNRTWPDIAAQLGITGDPGKVRSRWRVLQPKHGSAWTKSEDADLAAAVDNCIREGRVIGDCGVWVAVAKQLKTSRTAAQCQSRWMNTLLPRQGRRLKYTRFKSIHGWTWQPDEVQRLRSALDTIAQVQDSPDMVSQAAETEPWLLTNEKETENRVRSFWPYIASRVKTRTAMQCRRKWEAMSLEDYSRTLTASQAKQLVELVKAHGRNWQFLAETYFPGKSPKKLYVTYTQWLAIEKKYAVDLLQIDPFARLYEFDGVSALRPTGEDGYYDPNGPLARVRKSGPVTTLTPYILSLVKAKGRYKTQRRLLNVLLPGSTGKLALSPSTIEQFISAVSQYKNDWVSISRAMDMPPGRCRLCVEALAKKFPLVGRLIQDAELEDLARKHSSPGTGGGAGDR